MQGIQDVITSGGNYIFPVIKGILNTTSEVFRGITCGKQEVIPQKIEIPVAVSELTFNRNVIRLAGLSGAVAVALGAYGAHVVMTNPDVPDEQKISFRTANLYHFIGTGGLIAASLGRFSKVSAFLISSGSLFFCGACYFHSFTGRENAKKLAPIGGITLILAWLSLIV